MLNNETAQHYLVHLFRETLAASQSRLIFVSSGAVRNVRGHNPGELTLQPLVNSADADHFYFPETLDADLKANSGAGIRTVYSASKFVQLLGAHYWRRALPQCLVVAVSPGLIPETKLAQSMNLSMDMPDAKTIPEGKEIRVLSRRDENFLISFIGARNILRAFTVVDLPADAEQILLTSWGEWWPKDVYASSLDTNLQAKWCLSKEEIERAEGLAND